MFSSLLQLYFGMVIVPRLFTPDMGSKGQFTIT